MSLSLRPYQLDLHAQAKQAIAAGSRSVVLQLSTGGGKTVIAAHMLKNCVSRGFHAWFICHRKELVHQTLSTLTQAADMSVGIVAAGFSPTYSERVQVCMVGSLARRIPLLRPPDLIIFDEVHHVVSKSWREIKDQFPQAIHVGITATPERLDGTGLGECFETLIQGPSVSDLISQGWLSPYKLYAPSNPDLSGVHTVAGDYNRKELSQAMNSSAVVGDALQHYQRHCLGKRAIVFAWSVEASVRIAAEFQSAGIPAAHLDGNTDDRQRDSIVRGFRDGSIRVISNVDILGEGFDVPAAEVAFLLRPTKSLSVYLQQVGRVMRPGPGKVAAIFDHAGNCRRHGMPDDDRVWSLDGRPRRKTDRETPVKQCPRCYGFNSASAMTCRDCGFEWEIVGREVATVEGDLSEVDVETARRVAKAEQSAACDYDSLVALGRSRGYPKAELWARHVMRGRGSSYWAQRNQGKKAAAVAGAVVEQGELL